MSGEPEGLSVRGTASATHSRSAKSNSAWSRDLSVGADMVGTASSLACLPVFSVRRGNDITVVSPRISVNVRTRGSANASAKPLAARSSGSNGLSHCMIRSRTSLAVDCGLGVPFAQSTRRARLSGGPTATTPSRSSNAGRTQQKGTSSFRRWNVREGISLARPSSRVGAGAHDRNKTSARDDSAHSPAEPRRSPRMKLNPKGSPRAEVSNRQA